MANDIKHSTPKYRLDRLTVALWNKGIDPIWNEETKMWNLIDKRTPIDEDELRIRCKEIDSKNELIDELNEKIDRLWLVNNDLNKKIKELEKENKDLKDTIEKHEEFGKNIGKRVADSIREACEKDVCKLSPYTRIDIHVEETNNMPTTFDRHAIPRIAIIFNNTQTEMERDTAEHECEVLDEKFKELVKENNELRMTLAMCERDANMARELCHTVAFNAERARNKTPWFNE